MLLGGADQQRDPAMIGQTVNRQSTMVACIDCFRLAEAMAE
jgi:hypothetical protein